MRYSLEKVDITQACDVLLGRGRGKEMERRRRNLGESISTPAYPLITHNPNFSIWSGTDQLNASTTINKNSLKAGENVIAIHLANTAGGRFLGFGLVDKMKDNSANILLAEQKSVE